MPLDEQMSAELRDELASDARRVVVIDPREVPVRFSRLRAMARSALHYWQACQEADVDSLSRKLGRGVHALVLGQEHKVIEFGPPPGGTFNGKPYKGTTRSGGWWDHFQKEHAGKEILSASELFKARAIAAAIGRHDRAMDMLTGAGTLLEHELAWTWMGRRCQSHLDVYRPGLFVADLKTARDAAPDRFDRAAIWSHYHAQLAFYVMAAEAQGHPTPDPFLIVVESAPPYPVLVRPISPRALEQGLKQCRLWMEQLLVCEAANEWPSYSARDVPLDVPEDAFEYFVPDDVAA
jgi:hypothetical protein